MVIENKTFDMERKFYGSSGLEVNKCKFDGPADGESAFKECHDIKVSDCYFNLRYPFWHNEMLNISGSEMTDKCRAALWYSHNINIADSKLHGIKALRECSNVKMQECDIISPEFGWSVKNITMENCTVQSEYFMMRSEGLCFKDVCLDGKYSFQYIENSVFDNCEFNTKDAFWHAKNVTIKNSIIKGEYLAWYCENVTFENCKITGTQPLCYCKGLKLVNCEMYGADLCFEKSEANATITTPVISSDVLPPLKKWGLPAQEYQRIQYQRANPVRPTVFTNDVPFVPWIFYAQKEAWFSHIRFLCATQYIQLSMY